MNIGSLIKNEIVAEFDAPFDNFEGVTFELAYLSNDRIKNIRERHTKNKYDSKAGRTFEQLDEDGFMKEYSISIIKGWKGLKMKHLPDLIPVDMDSIKNKLEEEVPYNEENTTVLLKNSRALDRWVSDQISELTNFTRGSGTEKQEDSSDT